MVFVLVDHKVFPLSAAFPNGRILRRTLEPAGPKFREKITDTDRAGKRLKPDVSRLVDDAFDRA